MLASTDSMRAATAPDRFDLKRIDSYLAAEVLEKGRVGLSVAIVKNGKVVLAKGYGLRSLQEKLPVESETMFAIGSITKQFTCACVLLLVQEGKLSTHDKVSKYFYYSVYGVSANVEGLSLKFFAPVPPQLKKAAEAPAKYVIDVQR